MGFYLEISVICKQWTFVSFVYINRRGRRNERRENMGGASPPDGVSVRETKDMEATGVLENFPAIEAIKVHIHSGSPRAISRIRPLFFCFLSHHPPSVSSLVINVFLYES